MHQFPEEENFFISSTHDKTKRAMKEDQYETNSNMESFQIRMLAGHIYQGLKSWETLIFYLALESLVK